MLIRFSIENFLSFKERTEFSMIAGRSGRDKKSHFIKDEKRNAIPILKFASIHGANASGKSNLMKAVKFSKDLILNGTKPGSAIQYQTFRLDEKTRNANSRIEFEIQHKGKMFAYGFVFNKKDIIEEWLFEISKNSEKPIFERTEIDKFDIEPIKELNKVETEQQFLSFLAKGTLNNQLFLTEVKNRKVKENVSNIEDLLTVIDWFENCLTIFFPNSKVTGIEFKLKSNQNLKNSIIELLEYFGTGIDDICLEKVDFEKIGLPEEVLIDIKDKLNFENAPNVGVFLTDPLKNMSFAFTKEGDEFIAEKLMTIHKISGSENTDRFDLKDESDGTRRLIDIIPLLLELFKNSKVVFIDEPERSLHPNLLYDLVDLFLQKTSSMKNQLIIASHESSLLTQKLLRIDELWFVHKNVGGSTNLYSLVDFSIRYDKQIRKDYLLGRFKAVPKIGNRNTLSIFNNNTDAKGKKGTC